MSDNNKVIAQIDDIQILQSDLDFMIKNLNPQIAMNYQGEQGRLFLIQELINQRLVLENALKEQMEEEEAFQEDLKKLKENALTQYALAKVISPVDITEEEMKSIYEENQSSFQRPEQIRASHILVEEEQQAQDIKKQLFDGASFADLAQEFSTCPSSAKGGDLGTFGRGQMVPEFEEAAFALAPMEVSEPVKTQFGYHIIQVTEKTEAEQQNFDEVKDNIGKTLLANKQRQAYEQYINSLREGKNIEIMA